MEEEGKATQQSSSKQIYLWIIGGVLLLVAGWFGFKVLLSPFENYTVTLVDAPKEVAASSTATFTWRIDGPATSFNHTAVHLGTVSNPGELGKEIKPGDTKYTDFVKDFASGDLTVPLQFVGNITLTIPGTYYYRVHALVKDKNYWTDEYTLEVKPGMATATEHSVSLINAPDEVVAKNIFTITWRVDGPATTINHTAAHFGKTSTPDELGQEIKPADTKYKTYTIEEFADGNYSIPLQFVGNGQINTAGTYYYRVHAIVDGKNYWADEKKLVVTKSTEATQGESTESAQPTSP